MDITYNEKGEPLPWEDPEYVKEHGEPVNSSVKQDFKCANSECQNRVDTPTFCSDKCRKEYWGPYKGERKKWTLEQAQQWCKDRAEEMKAKRLANTQVKIELADVSGQTGA